MAGKGSKRGFDDAGGIDIAGDAFYRSHAPRGEPHMVTTHAPLAAAATVGRSLPGCRWWGYAYRHV
jgi:hypothetical protein